MKTILVDAVDAFIVEAVEGFCVFGPLQEMLDSFPNTKIILTGANDEQFIRFGLTEMPYEVFTLKHNPEKTEPEYYQKMLAHFSLVPQDVVYFEHNPEAVKSAQSVGIKAYLWDNETRPVSELQKFLEENL
jgi:HAD superfamily hydrolase (TIGR01509 family)